MTLPDFLLEDALGEIRIVGHRIGLYHIVRHYNEGYSPEMLQEQFPTLSLATIHKVIAYYLDNFDEANAYVARCRAEIDRQATELPRGPSMDELRKRLAAQRKAESA